MKSFSSISVKPEPRREEDVPANLSACGGAAHPVGAYAPTRRSFTLVEMMVSMALLAILGYILLQITTLVATTNARIGGGVSSFQDASIAFDTLTKTLSQATLNTYIDYYPSQLGATINISTGNLTTTSPPSIYIRQSELHFVCGQAVNLVSSTATANNNPTHAVFFQAPLGYSTTYTSPPIPDLLNACGFYIAFGNNTTWLPTFLVATSPSNLYRYRLMEMLQPTENLGVYTDPALTSATTGSVLPSSPDSGTSPATFYNWITNATTTASNVRPLADNIIAFVVQPMLSPTDLAALTSGTIFPTSLYPVSSPNTATSSDYSYDSRRDAISTTTAPYQQLEQNQLPPLLQVTMVAIDETSAIRLAAQYGTTSPNLIAKAQAAGSTPGNALFAQTSNFTTDLNTLTTYLAGIRVKYRVFTAQVPMFNAKWTTR
jgi:uncharacterized protein (TIGR02599 family)